jgi:hypothetical protein
MVTDVLDREIERSCKEQVERLEKSLKADVIFFYGELAYGVEKLFRDAIERLKEEEGILLQLKIRKEEMKRLAIVLNTPGGSVEIAEKLVTLIRYHYDEVDFVVPDSAMSAGTVWCMSGDRIYMDYSSALGPVDPQIYNGEHWVPALGYLDKVNELIKKSSGSKLSPAEVVMLTRIDLAELRSYEQAKELTISLLREWLVTYKFKNWTVHRTDPVKIGQPVTDDEKKERAEQIAMDLNDTRKWFTHGRSICTGELQGLRLEIEDYSKNKALQTLIRQYNDMLIGYIARMGYNRFLHSRNHF